MPKAKSNSSPSHLIKIEGVQKWYGSFHALKNINLDISKSEKIVICGPSGSGKSTLIRCVNRLEAHNEGRIVVDGIELSDDPHNILEIRKEVGMVFQQFNLFPHLTVLENLCLAPTRVKKISQGEAMDRAIRHTNIPRNSREGSSSEWPSLALSA